MLFFKMGHVHREGYSEKTRVAGGRGEKVTFLEVGRESQKGLRIFSI